MNQRPGNAWHSVGKAAARYVVQYEDATWTSSDRGFSITMAGWGIGQSEGQLNERQSLRRQIASSRRRCEEPGRQSEKKKNKPRKDYESASLNKMMIGEGNRWRLESGPWKPQARDQEPEPPRKG
ncbi:hypothetical protein GB937_008197 [Aspergillus fischeri]|nr:hypothetical protein GB937_008197 [Aspergillus fischeri]